MKYLDSPQIIKLLDEQLESVYTSLTTEVQNVRLEDIVRSINPYLLQTQNANYVPQIVAPYIDARLSTLEEFLLEHVLKELAIHVNQIVYKGQRSLFQGIDLEFAKGETYYAVTIQSDFHLDDVSHQELRHNFNRARLALQQRSWIKNAQTILGIYYGNASDTDEGDYIKICGQRFWNFISGEPNLYIDIVQPLGYEARKRNEAFLEAKAKTYNRLIREFAIDFCDESGQIDWAKLVQFNSGNLKD